VGGLACPRSGVVGHRRMRVREGDRHRPTHEVERVRPFAGIGEIPTVHAADTLQNQ